MGLSPTIDANVALISVLKHKSKKIIKEINKIEGAMYFAILFILFLELIVIIVNTAKIITILDHITLVFCQD